jgi:hypothetical protein
MRDTLSTLWVKVADVPSGTTKYTVRKLRLDSEYMFRVTAVNAEGDSPPLMTTTPTSPVKKLCTPAAPESIHVRKVGKNFADIEWSPPKSDGGSKITCYRIYKSTVLPPVWQDVAKVCTLPFTRFIQRFKGSAKIVGICSTVLFQGLKICCVCFI